ncbi:MAG: hypothetical protein RMX63_34045 [Aulosira sp. ZfuCHP01]|nr:hypothetical protein [Aulosira sp. ZfuCHP01]
MLAWKSWLINQLLHVGRWSDRPQPLKALKLPSRHQIDKDGFFVGV